MKDDKEPIELIKQIFDILEYDKILLEGCSMYIDELERRNLELLRARGRELLT